MSNIELIYIAGAGRSGSTAAGRVIAKTTGYKNVGEFYLYFTRNYLFDSTIPCSCGKPLSECNQYHELRGNEYINKNVKKMDSLSRKRRTFSKVSDFEREYIDQLNRFLVDSYNCNCFIDTSKSPGLIKYFNKKNTVIVHITKEPAATIKSWSRKKGYLEEKSFFAALHDWVYSNYLTILYSKVYGLKYFRVNDCDITEEYFKKLFNIDFDNKNLDNHVIAGNPNKFSSEKKIDKSNFNHFKLNPLKKIIVKIVGFPLGY